MSSNTWREKTNFPLSEDLYKELHVKGGAPYPLLPLSTGTLSGLNLCRSNEHCHSLCEFRCTSVLCVWKTLFPWSHQSPWLFIIFLCPLPQRSLSFEKEGFDDDAPFRTECFTVSCSAHCLVVGLCEFLSTAISFSSEELVRRFLFLMIRCFLDTPRRWILFYGQICLCPLVRGFRALIFSY